MLVASCGHGGALWIAEKTSASNTMARENSNPFSTHSSTSWSGFEVRDAPDVTNRMLCFISCSRSWLPPMGTFTAAIVGCVTVEVFLVGYQLSPSLTLQEPTRYQDDATNGGLYHMDPHGTTTGNPRLRSHCWAPVQHWDVIVDGLGYAHLGMA